MKLRNLNVPVKLCVCLLACSAVVQAQSELPDNWQSLSAVEFCDAVEPALKTGTIDADVHEQVKAHAADTLLALAPTEPDYGLLTRLQRIGRRVFHASEDKSTQLIDILERRQDDWTGKPYAEARKKIKLLDYMSVPIPELLEVAKAWRDAGGQLTDITAEDLPFAHYVFTPAEFVDGKFDIRWEGFVTAPRDGDFTFSVSPVNVNAKARDYYVQTSMSVSINGRAIINATPEEWNHTGDSISMRAGVATPIQVDLSVESSGEPVGVLHAMLFWEGPGVQRTVVPAAQLTTDGSEGNGLEATYTWQKDGQYQRLTRTDSAIDFVWGYGTLGLTDQTDVKASSSDLLWERTTSDEFLNGLEASGEVHPFFLDPFSTTSGLSSTQRQTFLKELVLRPDLLNNVPPKSFWKFYAAFRLGAVDEALDAVSVWAIQNADHCAVMAGDTSHTAIDIYFRDACRRIGHYIAHQTDQADTLRDQQLELASGSCCLPVAYILGYSYLTKGTINEWISFLDAKLDQPAVAGDARVNWLLARAQAEEVRLGSTKPYSAPGERLLAGREYVEEAATSAATPESECRCALELAARLSATRQFDECRDGLNAAVGSLPQAQQQEITAALTTLDRAEASHAQANNDREVAAREAYRNILIKRRDRASAAGNTVAVERYDRLIEASSTDDVPLQ